LNFLYSLNKQIRLEDIKPLEQVMRARYAAHLNRICKGAPGYQTINPDTDQLYAKFNSDLLSTILKVLDKSPGGGNLSLKKATDILGLNVLNQNQPKNVQVLNFMEELDNKYTIVEMTSVEDSHKITHIDQINRIIKGFPNFKPIGKSGEALHKAF
jgi:hypothetical protein